MAISQIVQNSLANTISLGPKITSVQVANSTYVVKDDTAVNVGGGYIVITGSGFQSNCSVLVDTSLACSVSFISSTQIRAELPAKSAGTYNIYVLNGDGGTAIRVNALQYSNTPVWITGSPLTSQLEDTPVSIQLSATGANTYALQSGSTLPTGLTLSANGLISGTVNTNVSTATTYNFTVEAIDTENQETPKAFSVTITVQQQISRSLRFNRSDSAYLTRTPASNGNRKTFTYSCWFKYGQSSDYSVLFSAFNGTNDQDALYIDDTTYNQQLVIRLDTIATVALVTNQVLRDPAAWYHLVMAMDTTQATASNRLKLYLNGVEITSFAVDSRSSISLNSDMNAWNTNRAHYIGSQAQSAPAYTHNGYMAEIYFIDGQALTPDTFGMWDNGFGGTWVPKYVTGVTYGTNGFYLPFTDNSNTTSATLGKDNAGSNNWTPTNFSVTAGSGNDSLVDSPTPYGTDDGSGADVRGSYCVLNPLDRGSNLTFSEGNLRVVGSGNPNNNCRGTVGVKSGKWYWECVVASGVPGSVFGIAGDTCSMTTNFAGDMYAYDSNGNKVVNGTSSGYGASYIATDLIGIAFDADNLSITFYKNNVSQGTITGITSGLTWRPFVHANGVTVDANFGQRPFAYTAPSGYKCLVSENITPEINANSSTTLANSYFGVVTYSGTGSELNVTGLNFDPDFVWIKQRNGADVHVLVDKVRGDDGTRMYVLNTDNTQSEAQRTESTTAVVKSSSWPSNGFRVGTNGQTNSSGGTYVAWAWKAGSSNVTNNDGSVTGTVRANPTAGFSIVSFASGAAGQKTVGHGLSKTPKFIIMRARDNTSYNWSIYHASVTDTTSKFLRFTTDGLVTSSTIWGASLPTSSVFGFTSDNGIEANKNCIAYCWAEIEGFSKIGSYVGNGSSDGPFVYCGFRPAFIMIKGLDAGNNWLMLDMRREPANPVSNYVVANSNAAENGASVFTWLDITSNGFKNRNTGSWHNTNGTTYSFIAFAEHPFKYARAR